VILAMTKTFGFEPSGNSKSHSKSFNLSLPFTRSKAQTEAPKTKMSLSQVKLQVELSLQDIESHDVERLRYKIRAVREVRELWMLRSDVHQVIAKRISQQEAAKRINALLPCFEGWVPAKSLVKI
jgi:ERCC4-type nuclease